eukprot:2247767-Amphidinium_carterae.1
MQPLHSEDFPLDLSDNMSAEESFEMVDVDLDGEAEPRRVSLKHGSAKGGKSKGRKGKGKGKPDKGMGSKSKKASTKPKARAKFDKPAEPKGLLAGFKTSIALYQEPGFVVMPTCFLAVTPLLSAAHQVLRNAASRAESLGLIPL